MDGRMAGIPVGPGDVITVDQDTWNDNMTAAQGGDLDDLDDDGERV